MSLNVKSSGAGTFQWQKSDEFPPPTDIVVDMDGACQNVESVAVAIINSASEMLVVAGSLAGRQDVMEGIRYEAGMGSRPYILADSVGMGNTISQNLGRHALVRYMNGFGAGIVLADPSTMPSGAFMYNGSEGSAKISVVMSRRQIQDAYHALRWAFWERADGEFADGKVHKYESLGIVAPPMREWVKIQTSDHSRISDRVGEILQDDNENIIVLNPHWDDHSSLAAKLCSASRGGANVQVITQTNGGKVSPVLRRMIQAGIRVLGFMEMHARAIITDGPCLVVSGGWEQDGADPGFQIGVEMNGTQCRILRKAVNDWTAKPQFQCEYVTAPPGPRQSR